MVRGLWGLLCTVLAGCSLVLDFSDEAIPKDATPDSPFSEEECNFKEPNDSVAEPALFDPTEIGPAAICERNVGVQDRDFYKFTVPAGTTVTTIRITFTSSATGDLDLRIYDGTGANILGSSTGFMDVEEIICPGQSPLCNQNMPLPAGDYLFEVFAPLVGGLNRYDIALTLTM